MLEQIEALKDHPNARPILTDAFVSELVESTVSHLVTYEFVVDPQFTAVVFLQVIDAAKQRTLARSRRADQARHLATINVQSTPFNTSMPCTTYALRGS